MRRGSKTRNRFIIVLLLSLSLAIIASSVPPKQTGIISNDKSTARQPPQTTAQPADALSTGAYFDHVVLIMMENRALADICGSKLPPPCNGNLTSNKPATPFMAGLANNYTLGTQYVSVINTSLPNYVALIGGSTFNCGSGGCGGVGTITASNLVDRLETSNLSWKAYFESYPVPSGCFGTSSGSYNNFHNPFIWFNDINSNSTRCAKLVNANPSSCTRTDCTLINDLNGASPPGLAWLTPNDCDNMHGNGACTNNNCLGTDAIYRTPCIVAGESYLKTLVPNILNSTTFKTQRSALFITFDEGTGNCPSPNPTSEDCVYAVWAGPVAKKNNPPSNNLYNHYSVLKTVEVNWNLTSLQTNDLNAAAMKEFFAPDFSISANLASLTVTPGATGTSTITGSSLSGFNGTVSLTALSNPSGPTLTFNPQSIILKALRTNSSTLSFSSPSTGNYTLTISGTSGSNIHSITITISVVPPVGFSISANPSALTLGQPSSANLASAAVTTSGDRTWFESSYLPDSFNAQGLTWMFYENYSTSFTCEHHSGCLYYTTSPDGSAWARSKPVNNNAGTLLHVADSDFSVYSNATYVFYVRYNQTSFQSSCNRELYVRQGKLSTAGTVAWNPEIKILTAASWQTFDDTYIIMDSTGQLWLGYMISSKMTCGGSGKTIPVVFHSNGTNYAQPWIGNSTLSRPTEPNNVWNVALLSLSGGQMYASFWAKHYSLQGRFYNGTGWSTTEEQISNPAGTTNPSTGLCSGGACLDVNAWTWASGSTVYDLYFENTTKDYYVATRNNGSWNTPGNVAASGDRYTGFDCCGTGTVYKSTAWYSLPDAASFYNGTFYLYYMQASNSTIDQWSGGSSGAWTKTAGIVRTASVPYPDSITSFITYSPTSSIPPTGGIFYISGSASPFTYNYATLALGSPSNFTVTITGQNGFTGTITLSPTVSPSTGLTASCSPTSIPGGSGSSTCSLKRSAAGNYTVTVTGTSGSISNSVTVNVQAVDFSLNDITTLLVAQVGTNATSILTLSSLNGYSGNINLNVTVLPPPPPLVAGGGGGRHPLLMAPLPCPPTPSINPNSITLVGRGSGQSTLTIALSLCVQAGTYPIVVMASDGTTSHSIQLTMMATDFSITSPTNNVGIPAGSNSTLTLSLQSLNGFQGTILLSITVAPSGPSATLKPITVLLSANSNSSLLTILVPSNTPSGNYNLTVQAASGSLVHTISITIMVSTGAVGGLALAVDKLGLAMQLLPASTSILLILASAIVGVWTSSVQGKRQVPHSTLRRLAAIHEWRCYHPRAYSTTIGPFWRGPISSRFRDR